LKWFYPAGIAAGLIYHTGAGIAACQENLSDGAFGSQWRPAEMNPKSLPITHSELPIDKQAEERFTCLPIGNSEWVMGNDGPHQAASDGSRNDDCSATS
jgi:hypothetical protein